MIYGKYGYKNAFASLRFAFFGNRRRIFRTTGEKNRKIRFACHIRSVCRPLPCGDNPFRTFADIQMKKSRGLTKAAAFFFRQAVLFYRSQVHGGEQKAHSAQKTLFGFLSAACGISPSIYPTAQWPIPSHSPSTPRSFKSCRYSGSSNSCLAR